MYVYMDNCFFYTSPNAFHPKKYNTKIFASLRQKLSDQTVKKILIYPKLKKVASFNFNFRLTELCFKMLFCVLNKYLF